MLAPTESAVDFDGDEFNFFDTIEALTGATTDEVMTALEDGQSLADLAATFGVSDVDLIDALVADTRGLRRQRLPRRLGLALNRFRTEGSK